MNTDYEQPPIVTVVKLLALVPTAFSFYAFGMISAWAGAGLLAAGLMVLSVGFILDFLARCAHELARMRLEINQSMRSPQSSPPSTKLPAKYFYSTDQGAQGPVDLTEIIGKVARGDLTREVLVAREGEDGWIQFRDVAV